MTRHRNLKKNDNFSYLNLLWLTLVFGAIGTYIIITSFAANPNLPGDVNNDNTVDSSDLTLLLANYGTAYPAADFNSNNTVDVSDFSVVLSHFGQKYTGSSSSSSSGGGAPTCTQVLSSTANILNSYNAAHAGDVLCLPPNAVYDQGQIDFRNAIGVAGSPITITSQDYSQPATLVGRLVTHPPANYITLSHLILDAKYQTSASSFTIGSDHVSLVHNDITDDNTGICINTIDDSTYGTAHYTLIDQNRIYNCGEVPSTNTDHGIYDIGYYSTITNNYIYDNIDRGIQLREDHNAFVEYNTVNNNGEGMIVGDTNVAAVNDEVEFNIFSNSNIRNNIEEFWSPSPPPTPNNRIHDNCVWATNTDSYYNTNGGVPVPFSGATVTNVKIANPMYTNAAAKDFTLQAGSGCSGYGVQPGIKPGP